MPPRRPRAAKLAEGSCDLPQLSTTTTTSTTTRTSTVRTATRTRFAKPFGDSSASPNPSLDIPRAPMASRKLHERRLWQQRERYCYPCVPHPDVDLDLDASTTLDMSTCDCQHRHSPYSNPLPGQSSARGLGQGMLDGCTPHCIAFVLAGVLTVFLASVIYVIARVYCQRLRTKKDEMHHYPDDDKADFTTCEQGKEDELEERAARLPSISDYLDMHNAAPVPIDIAGKDRYHDSDQSKVPNGYIHMPDLAAGQEEIPKQGLGSRISVGRPRRGSGLYSGPLRHGLRRRRVTETAY